MTSHDARLYLKHHIQVARRQRETTQSLKIGLSSFCMPVNKPQRALFLNIPETDQGLDEEVVPAED
ncbi:hypothetical protein BB934_01910 [Microvirga ossetica]|uniref:Uncharacterized protein n=1 Tax=Microvirga ossetica TaxID=1882682 RepID=A0A1B2EB11_9HYPH|nr:hypothetical protein BB934_01910 [Microvirga ossetica]